MPSLLTPASYAFFVWALIYLLSVFILLLLLGCLFRIIYRTQMELTDPPPVTVVFLWWPFCYYIGWIVFALFEGLGRSGAPEFDQFFE